MTRILAVDWDRREARYVLASTHGEKLTIHAAAAIPPADVLPDGDNAPLGPGELLRAALGRHKVDRVVTLVGVDRASIELMHFALPPANDAELPPLVANQAMRESQIVTEDSALDFLPMNEDPTQPREVTVAVLSSEQLQRIHTTCAAAGIKPSRMLLRPYASSSLFLRTASPPEAVCLLINLVADEVDLTVLDRNRVVFARTLRLPETDDEKKATQWLVSEIGRTLAVWPQSSPGVGPVEGIYIFGGPGDHEHLVDRIRQELSLPATVLDPFVAVDVAQNLVPENSGRFASLLGMLLDEATGERHAIDFLHPRRGPAPPNRLRQAIIAAAAAALVVLVGGLFMWDKLATLDAGNRELAAEAKRLGRLAKQAEKKKELVQAIRGWEAHDVNWLDELRDLSLRFPSSRDVMVLRMSMAPARGGGGTIDLSGLVRDPSIVVRMEQNVRDQYHEVRSKRVHERHGEKAYTWRFDTLMIVSKREKRRYLIQFPMLPAVDPNDAEKVGQPEAKPN